jgi:molybdenum cofactor synthesis domain-containing protein
MYGEAHERVMAAVCPITRTETVALVNADRRVAAHDVLATSDVPAFDRALMDGYAVRAGDVRSANTGTGTTLQLLGTVYTGDSPSQTVGAGTCVAIGTGAPIPAGADAVVMVEQTDRDGDVIRVRARVALGQNVGRRGADLAAGDVVIAAGTELGPAQLGSLAAAGVTKVDVFCKPTVALLSTGNEIVSPGDPLPPGHVYDVNRFTIGAVVERHGGLAAPMRAAGDTIDELTAALDDGARHDIIVFSGGSSVGTRDLMLDALEARGGIHFHGVAIKPGKPMLFGHVESTPVFGMPGNPASCLSNAYMFLVPFLRATARRSPWQPRIEHARVSQSIDSPSGRHQFYPVRLRNGVAEPAFKSSGDITSLANADGYFEIPADLTRVEAGTTVAVKIF